MSAQSGARPHQLRFGPVSPEELVRLHPRDVADIRTQLRRIADALERLAPPTHLDDIETR